MTVDRGRFFRGNLLLHAVLIGVNNTYTEQLLLEIYRPENSGPTLAYLPVYRYKIFPLSRKFSGDTILKNLFCLFYDTVYFLNIFYTLLLLFCILTSIF